MRKTARGLATGAAVACALSLTPPAYAASGGVCRDSSHIRSCISYTGSSVFADFDTVLPLDLSATRAEMIVRRNDGVILFQDNSFVLDHQGRYGPRSKYVVELPSRYRSAVSFIDVYNHRNVKHYTAPSPRLYWP